MSDDDLISYIASFWVANGGDVDGFSWCYGRIKDAIKDELERITPAPTFKEKENEAKRHTQNKRIAY